MVDQPVTDGWGLILACRQLHSETKHLTTTWVHLTWPPSYPAEAGYMVSCSKLKKKAEIQSLTFMNPEGPYSFLNYPPELRFQRVARFQALKRVVVECDPSHKASWGAVWKHQVRSAFGYVFGCPWIEVEFRCL